MGTGEATRRVDDDGWLPIKFGPVSNGEFHPVPHSPFVREVVRRTHRLADDNARRLGISRAGGPAAVVLRASVSERIMSTERG